MITILNRKRLLADSSSETAAKAREALKAAGIPYYMKTVQNHTSLGKSIHAGAGVGAFRGGMPAAMYISSTSGRRTLKKPGRSAGFSPSPDFCPELIRQQNDYCGEQIWNVSTQDWMKQETSSIL